MAPGGGAVGEHGLLCLGRAVDTQPHGRPGVGGLLHLASRAGGVVGVYTAMGRGTGARGQVKLATATFPASILLSWGRKALGFPRVLERPSQGRGCRGAAGSKGQPHPGRPGWRQAPNAGFSGMGG